MCLPFLCPKMHYFHEMSFFPGYDCVEIFYTVHLFQILRMKVPPKRAVPRRRHVVPLAHVLLERVPARDLVRGAHNSGEILKVRMAVSLHGTIFCVVIQLFSRRLGRREAQAATPCKCRLSIRPPGRHVKGGGLEVAVFGEVQVSCCGLSNIHILLLCFLVKDQAKEPVVLRWPEEIRARMERALTEAVAERVRVVQVRFLTFYSQSYHVVFMVLFYIGIVTNPCL